MLTYWDGKHLRQRPGKVVAFVVEEVGVYRELLPGHDSERGLCQESFLPFTSI